MGVPGISTVSRKLFGSRNDRMVKRYLKLVEQVSSREAETRLLTDAELYTKTADFRKRVSDGESATDLIPEVFAIAREAMDRAVGIRNIFNPLHEFDATLLTGDARKLYDETKAIIDATEDRNPDRELL